MSTYPVFLDHSPQKNFIGAQLDAPIFFRAEDPDGLNVSTLNVMIEGSVYAIENGVYKNGYTGVITNEDAIPNAISVLIIPPTNWSFSQEVNVATYIEDLLGTRSSDGYVFITIPNPDKTAPIVVASPNGGIYNTAQNVTLTANESNVTIYYTLDGSEPDLGSAVYSSPISISDEGITKLRFVGVDNNNNYDQKRIEEYEIDTVPPNVNANPVGGSFFSSLEVMLNSDDPQSTIFFTTNGVMPTTSSSVYTTPIPIPDNQSTTLKFFGLDEAGNSSTIKSEVYDIEIAKNNYKVMNLFVRHAYIQNELHLSWEDMHPMHTDIIGYNIYRSDYELGEYKKINKELITVNQYIDKTLDVEIVEEDVSEQFRRTVNISREIDDDFSGARVDVTKWTESDVVQLLFQHNNSLIFTDKTGLNESSKYTSKFKLKDDFDILIDYDLQEWPEPASTIHSCIFRVKRDDNNYIQIARERSQTSNAYTSNKYTNGNPDLPIAMATIDDYGTFRITRVGNVITTYFVDKTTGDFIQLQSYNSFTEDMYVEIVGKSSDVPVEFSWFKFRMDCGCPVIIEPLNQLHEYVIHVDRAPIVDSSGANKATDDITEVDVTINGQKAYIKRVEGIEGLIFLETDRVWDEVKKEYFTPPKPDEFSTVVVTYKTCLHTTKVDLRKNYFYKVTAVTNMDETDLGVLEPESIKNEKLTYIYEEAIRRNSWLRDQGGERVLLFIQKRAGQMCPCRKKGLKERTHVKPDQDCHVCFPAGTKVRTENGWKDIEKINIGERVLTSDGTYQKVNKTMVRDFEGDLASIETSVSTNPILATPNHPFLVQRGNHNKKIQCGPKCDNYIKNGDGLRLERPDVRKTKSGKWQARVQVNGSRNNGRIILGTYDTEYEAINSVQNYRIENHKMGHYLEWDKADNIKKNDWLVPRWNSDIKDIDEIKIPKEFLKKSNFGPKRNGKTKFKLDEDFLWVVGLYLAEGNSGTRSITFSLNKNEIEYANRVIELFTKYGYNTKIEFKKDNNGMVVVVNGSNLSEWFPEIFGDRCFNKKIPNEFMNLPSNKIWAIIRGIYAGDNGYPNEIIQTSEYLAIQLVELLHRVGEQPLVSKQISKKLTPKGNKRMVAYRVNWKVEGSRNNNRIGRWNFKGDILTRVKKVGKKKFNGLVYNLEVNGNHTYMVNGVVVHNCYGSGFVGGFFGPINIIVGNLTSEHRIQQTERGLKLMNQVETWTGNFPILTQRDMIIRRNGDRLGVGAITKVDGPGGVLVQQHFQVEVIDVKDIRYTFPIQPLPNQYTFPSPIDKKGVSIPEIDSPKEREELETNFDTPTGEDIPDVPSKKHDSNMQVDAVKRGAHQHTKQPRRGRSIKFENTNF